MDELFELLLKPVLNIILIILRILQFLAWDLLFSSIGWTIGWAFYRCITFGHFPREQLRDLDNCSLILSIFIEITGLVILGGAIYLIVSIL